MMVIMSQDTFFPQQLRYDVFVILLLRYAHLAHQPEVVYYH